MQGGVTPESQSVGFSNWSTMIVDVLVSIHKQIRIQVGLQKKQ